MATNQELYEKRASLIADARSIIDAADADSRELTSEQREQVDNMLDDSDAIKADVDQRLRLQKSGEMLEEVEARKSALAISQPQQKERAMGVRSEEYRDAFWIYLRQGKTALQQEQRAVMVEGTNTLGGFAAPMFDFGQATLQDMIIETMDDAQNFQQYATRLTVDGEITVPVQNDVGSAAWTTEGSAYNDSNSTFTQLKFQPAKATRIVQVSQELLSDSYVNLESFLAGLFGRSFATLLNDAFIAGSGTDQPTGIQEAADVGVTTASSDAILWSELTTLFYSLKESYRANGTWVFNSTTAAMIRNISDSGQGLIWQPSGQAGQPDMLLGRPVAINDKLQDADVATKRSVLFGDLSYYWITWRAGMNFQRLDELYAADGNVGLKADLRVDGKLTSSEAVKCMVMG